MKEALQIALTFFLTVIGWIIFRAETMTQAVEYLTAMFTNKFFDASTIDGKMSLLFCLLLMLVEWVQRNKQHALQFPNKYVFKYSIIRNLIYVIIVYLLFIYSGKVQTFIYFQF